MKKYLTLLLIIYYQLCAASVGSDLTHFYNGLGFSANASDPSAYRGQQAGFYTGGSLYLRNSVRNVQIAQIDLPQVSAGCGGIDAYLGGFSFINGQGMKTLSQNIMHGATGYVAELALEQTIPVATNVMRHMQDVANKINQFNINSCHAASQLVGAAGLKTQESQSNVCQSAAISQGRANSWTDAQELCRDPNQYQTIMSQANNDPHYNALIVSNSNVAWKAMRNNSFVKNDTELAELFMTISGSIIVEEGKSVYLPSRINDKNLVKALLKGGQAPIWRCDTTDSNGCLNPSAGTITIGDKTALENRVMQLLQAMQNKIVSDEALSQEEIGFLQSTRLPVYKMLNVQSAYSGDQSILDLSSYADVIASDILYQYLVESLDQIKASANTMQYPPSVMQPFMKGIDQAMISLREQQQSAYKSIEMTNSMVERTQMAERMLAGALSSDLYTNSKWADGVH